MGDSSGDETNRPVIRLYGEAGKVIETHEHAASSKRGERFVRIR